MNEREHPLHGRPWYREPWPWIVMAGPAAVVVAGLVTAWIAVAYNDPLVVDNYYKEGLAINRALARDEAAARAGCRAQLLFAEDGSRVRVYLTGDAPARLRLALIHPTRAGLDSTVELLPMQAGWYEGALNLAPAARWRVQLEDSQRTWRLSGEWRPEQGGALSLEPRS